MKKAAAVLLMWCLMLLCACGNHSSAASSFSLEIIDPQTTGTVGESITFTAELNNNAEQEYHLSHGIPLILLYIYPAEATPEAEARVLRSEDLHTKVYVNQVETLWNLADARVLARLMDCPVLAGSLWRREYFPCW